MSTAWIRVSKNEIEGESQQAPFNGRPDPFFLSPVAAARFGLSLGLP